MDGMEDRLSKLERQVRVYRALTIFATAVAVLFLGLMGYSFWRLGNLQEPFGRVVESLPLLTESEAHPTTRSLFTTVNGDKMYVSLVAQDHGWALQMHDENGLVGQHGEMSLAFRISPTDGTPTLALIDKAGKEVWHAP